MAKKLGLALGGGGAWSISELGVIKALVDEGIKIDYLSGVSMGALIAAGYSSNFAGGDTIPQMEKVLEKFDFRRALHIKRHQGFGLFSSEKVGKHFEDAIGKLSFEDLTIPLSVSATDFKTGEEVVFDKGPLTPALTASATFTLLFAPFEYQGRLFTDGGMSNPTPVDIARKMGADVVIGVDVTNKHFLKRVEVKPPAWHHKIIMRIPPLHFITSRKMGGAVMQMFDILFSNMNRYKIMSSPPDFLLVPEVNHLPLFDFKNTEVLIKEGERVTKEIIPELKKLLGS